MRFTPATPSLRLVALLATMIANPLLLTGCKDPQPSDVTQEIASAPTQEYNKAVIESRLKTVESGLVVESVSTTPIRGLLEVALNNGQLIYTTEDARYVLNGKLFELSDKGLVDLGAEKLRANALQALAQVKPGDMITYPAQNAKTHITIFTDVDCPYCQKLHSEVEALTENGIEVRYLAFPRLGMESETAGRMTSIWCAEDRKASLDAALKQEPIERANCVSPVKDQFELGHKLGVNGTPAIFLADGTLKPGYSPAKELIEAALAAEASKK